MGISKAERQENARVNKNISRWEKANWCNCCNEEVNEITQTVQRYWGAGEVDSGDWDSANWNVRWSDTFLWKKTKQTKQAYPAVSCNISRILKRILKFILLVQVRIQNHQMGQVTFLVATIIRAFERPKSPIFRAFERPKSPIFTVLMGFFYLFIFIFYFY